jgi:hypothetical protein
VVVAGELQQGLQQQLNRFHHLAGDPRHQAFAQALTRIGLNPAMVQAIRNEGFNSVDDLLDIADDQINKLVKHIGQW